MPATDGTTDSKVISGVSTRRRHSPETRAKMSVSQQRRWADPEARAKMSASQQRARSDPELQRELANDTLQKPAPR